MNKTININLASTFFYMDENAYTILKSYLNELESAFKNTLGKDEILQDIETRIAELFQERKTSSDYVINETDVNEIIDILGQPKDFILEDEDETTDTGDTKSEKKLFRDREDRYIAGVASGLGHYFGIDASWIRLIWVLFALFSVGSLFLIYLILWAIVPEAKTTAEKLKMKGEPVNIDTIQKKIKKEFDEVSSKIKDVDYQKTTASLKKKSKSFFTFLEQLLKQVPQVIIKLLGLILSFFSGVGILGIFIGSLVIIFFGSIHWPIDFHFNFFNFSVFQSIYFSIALFLLLLIPFLFTFSLGMRLISSQSNAFGKISRIVLLIVWIAALVFIIIMGSQEIKNQNITATKTDTKELNIKKTDTLFVKLNSEFIQGDDLSWEYNRANRFKIALENFSESRKNAKINLYKSNKSFSFIELKYSANGATQEKAQINATNIDYNWKLDKSILYLDPLWKTVNSTPFYNQKININLNIQEGQIIFINNRSKDLLYSILSNDQGYSKRQITGHYWRMGTEKLECLDCSSNQQQLNIKYQDKSGDEKLNLNVDNQGVTIKRK